jgi:hypothetical protein
VAKKPLRYQNVGKKGGAKAIRQQLVTEGIDKELPKIRATSKKFKSATTAIRNQLILYVSDYISEEIGLGKKVKNANIFSTPKTAPDAEVDIKEFESLTGVKISQTEFMKGVAAQDVGFFETKVSGLGGSKNISFTAIEASGGSAGFAAIQDTLQRTKKQNITGVDAFNLLTKSNSLSGEFRKLQLAIKEKFENLLIVNVHDVQKGGKNISLDFVANPLGKLDVTNPAIFLKYVSLRIRPRTVSQKGTTERRLTSYRIEAKPTKALSDSFKVKDITSKVLNAQTKAFSTGLDIYLRKRVLKYAADKKLAPNDQKVSEIMGYAIALANEFKEGGQTPLVTTTKLVVPNLKILDGEIRVKNQTRQKAQKFISGAQITALVQRRLAQKMPKGPRRGPPLSENILTERTGRFRSSVQVIPDYRRSIMNFFYDPIYKTFIGTSRDPDRFVGDSVREVVQQLYSRNFLVTRT